MNRRQASAAANTNRKSWIDRPSDVWQIALSKRLFRIVRKIWNSRAAEKFFETDARAEKRLNGWLNRDVSK